MHELGAVKKYRRPIIMAGGTWMAAIVLATAPAAGDPPSRTLVWTFTTASAWGSIRNAWTARPSVATPTVKWSGRTAAWISNTVQCLSHGLRTILHSLSAHASKASERENVTK